MRKVQTSLTDQQCLFEKVNLFYLSLKSYQDAKIAKYF